jgi:hypothetical protein
VAVWLPDVQRNPGRDAGAFVGPVTIGLIHTTEGSSFTPDDDYYGHDSWPHLTFFPGDRPYGKSVWQHISLDLAARALANQSGGVETNREGVVQIEVVAFARDPSWSKGETTTVRNFRRLMHDVEAATDIPHRSSVVFGGNEQYGLNNGYELTAAEWRAYEGWCGHQHAPENSHWDPGAISIINLLLGDDMALTDAEKNELVRRTAEAVWARKDAATEETYAFLVRRAQARANQARDLCLSILAGVTTLAGELTDVDEDAIGRAAAAALLPDLAIVVAGAVAELPDADADAVADRVVEVFSERLAPGV